MKNNLTRARLFIGSSKEHVEYARAIQENLDLDFETQVWDQNVFKLSEYPLEALTIQLKLSDFGIFVLAPDDMVSNKGNQQFVPRDNVIFELGLFMGWLGRNRTFVVVPKGIKNLHLPTDLMGLTVGYYESNRTDNNLTAAVGSVSSKIRRLINERAPLVLNQRTGIIHFGLFSDTHFVEEFNRLLRVSQNITLYFIHSRRWRENHNDAINDFLVKSDTILTVFLPNISNHSLINSLKGHFDDGKHLPDFIADAYRFFAELAVKYPKKINIMLFNVYPTYTFYKFDDNIIVAMYPTTSIRKSVPAMQAIMDGTLGKFIEKDMEHLLIESKKISPKALLRFI